jgi:hypothetical protein
MPSVTERLLDDAVMAAVREAVVKPEVILKPLRQLQSAEMRERREHAQAAKSAEAVLARLKAEEERVLEAYRTGVITPAQLGQQLETVKARRSELESHAREAQQESTVPGGDADRAVSAYCAEAASNLASFTHERWQEFLRTIIDNIIFRGNQITIQGRIPAGGTAAQIRLESPVLRELRGLRPAR